MLVHFVVGHKITDLRIICTYPKIQPVVFVELIFQRESTNWASQIEKINHMHIDSLIVRQIIILDELNKKS